jgi:hypothetical protein
MIVQGNYSTYIANLLDLRSGYRYSNSYLSTNHNRAMCTYGYAMVLSMIRACALDCALHHAIKISMRDNGHWPSINKNTHGALHKSHQINRKAVDMQYHQGACTGAFCETRPPRWS